MEREKGNEIDNRTEAKKEASDIVRGKEVIEDRAKLSDSQKQYVEFLKNGGRSGITDEFGKPLFIDSHGEALLSNTPEVAPPKDRIEHNETAQKADSSDKSRLEVQVIGGSDATNNAVMAALNEIPVHLRDYVHDRIGAKFVIADNMKQYAAYTPDLRDQSDDPARGAKGRDYGQVEGEFDSREGAKNIVMVDKLADGSAVRPQTNKYIAKHEFGHALDYALATAPGELLYNTESGKAVDRLFSSTTEFKETHWQEFDNYRKNLEKVHYNDRQTINYIVPLDKDSRPVYQLRPTEEQAEKVQGKSEREAYEALMPIEMEKARKESFARVFEVIMAEQKAGRPIEELQAGENLDNMKRIKKYFPQTYQLVKDRLDAIKPPSADAVKS